MSIGLSSGAARGGGAAAGGLRVDGSEEGRLAGLYGDLSAAVAARHGPAGGEVPVGAAAKGLVQRGATGIEALRGAGGARKELLMLS